MTKRAATLAQENFVLRRALRLCKAKLVLARAERDAARLALANFNITEACRAIEEKMGLNL